MSPVKPGPLITPDCQWEELYQTNILGTAPLPSGQ